MKTKTYFLHALSPLHVGVGQSAEIIDLPIARLKGSNIPYVPGSAVKGVLREALRPKDDNGTGQTDGKNSAKEKLLAIFGPDVSAANDHAGALVCADARLFALPVRSYKGTFAYVTSPLLLALARRDLGSGSPPVPELQAGTVLVTGASALRLDGKVYLEDLDLSVAEGDGACTWAESIATIFGGKGEERAVFTKRFAVVDDETMTFLWETATQTDTRVRIDPETRSVARRALWIEESLPPETLLVGILSAERSRRRDVSLSPKEVLDNTLASERILQFGGKATVGRGRCRIVPFQT